MSGHMKFVCDITVAFLLSRVINPLFLSFVNASYKIYVQ